MPLMKRLMAWLLVLSLGLSVCSWGLAEDDESAAEAALMSEMQDDGEEEEEEAGQIRNDISIPPPASIYTGEVLYESSVVIRCSLREDKSSDQYAKKIMNIAEGTKVEILDVDADWVYARVKGKLGWLKRLWIAGRPDNLNESIPPYGVYQYNYVATVAKDTYVYEQLTDDRGLKAKVLLHPGAVVAIMDIYEGWGRFFYNHTYGYIDMADMTDLIMVSPTESPMSSQTPIAAYTTYYNTANTESNRGRMKNIQVACDRLERVYSPGDSLNFNKDIGPYTRGNGYFKAPVLVNGTSMPGYGGGTCQVSSTLFNVLLQLPDVAILQRRPHGQSGAKYLPIGVDAAVGNENLNLRFRNDYDFAMRLETFVQDGALTMVMWKAE
ncbi:MAG: VanW family protein [Clostridia bacterium]|nr:VanW family protein [Clostridia bacterium]